MIMGGVILILLDFSVIKDRKEDIQANSRIKRYLLVLLLKKKYSGYQFWLTPRFISLYVNVPSYKKNLLSFKEEERLTLINEISLFL